MVRPAATVVRESAGEDLGLLRGELVLGEHSLGLQVTELLELLQPVLGRGAERCSGTSLTGSGPAACASCLAHFWS